MTYSLRAIVGLPDGMTGGSATLPAHANQPMNDSRTGRDPAVAARPAPPPRARRGLLTLFFGAGAAAERARAMLEAGRRRKVEGADVVIGALALPGLTDDARSWRGLERIGGRAEAQKAQTPQRADELDLDAALARRPDLILVDHLAQVNDGAGRHAMRWQDVEELRDAGIDVFATLDVRQLDSLADIVAGVMGAAPVATVPDAVFESADEVVLVDLPPALAADAALPVGTLNALRELAVRRAGERLNGIVERGRASSEGATPWLTSERVMVAIGPSSDGDNLIRAGRRLAVALRAPWLVVYVETPDLQRLPDAQRDQRVQWLRLAESLGAETVTLGGATASDELVAYARTRHVSRLLLGAPRRRGWRGLRPSTVDQVLKHTRGIDVTVVQSTEAQRLARGSLLLRSRAFLMPAKAGRVRWAPYAWSALAVAVAGAVGVVAEPLLSETNRALLFLAGIVLVAWRFGRGPSVLASVASVLAFNYLFVEPRYTFDVTHGQYLVTFTVMMAVGLLVGQLMQSVRLQARVAGERERRTALLYAMSRELATSRGADKLARVATRHIGEVFDAQVVLLLPDARGCSVMPRGEPEPASLREVDRAIAQWVQDHGQPAGLGTATSAQAVARYLPLAGTRDGVDVVLGVIAVLPANARRVLLPEQAHLLDTFVSQVALALERVNLAVQAQSAQVNAETESVRNSLLAAISHDMRTPLAVIGGAASSLAEPDSRLSDSSRQQLARTIVDETTQMTQLITNVLDMTRLESGRTVLRLEWVSIEELIGSALHRLAGALRGFTVSTHLEAAPALIRADAVLLEQLFFNLIENVTRHAPAGTHLSVSARREADTVDVLVADDGPGFPADIEPNDLFEKFRRGRSEGVLGGVGLGLAICRAIARVHGGEIRAERIPAGGALFIVTLPLQEEMPIVPAEEQGA